MDQWPDNCPETLEDLCVQYCVRHLETFTRQDSQSKYYILLPGLSLPKTVCEKIFSYYIESVDDIKSVNDSFLNIFNGNEGTQISLLNLANTNVTDEGLKLVHTQPVIDLDLSECHRITSGCIPFINRMGKTLRSLRVENTPVLFEGLETCDPDFMSKSEDDKTDENGSLVLKCPNLRRLCFRGFNIDDCQKDGLRNMDLLDIFARSFQSLSHLDLTMCTVPVKTLAYLQHLCTLISLSLADVDIDDLEAAIDNLCQLHQIKHLDLSQGQCDVTPVMYPQPEKHLKTLMTGLPHLTSLDLSGTNLAGFDKFEAQSFRLGMKAASGATQDQKNCPPVCSIPGLERHSLDFLGLLGCAYGACSRPDIPAKQVTGDDNEDQVLLSLQVYKDRPNLLTKALNNLFPLFRVSTVNKQFLTLQALLAGMKQHPGDRHVQISGSASLFYIAKGEKKEQVTQKQRRTKKNLYKKC